MKHEINHEENIVRVQVFIEADQEKVFNAFTDPSQMKSWMGPGPVVCKDVQIDAKVGGNYRIHMVTDEGDHIAFGEYKTVNPHSHLAYSWQWEGGSFTNSQVEVSFEPKDSGTEVVLVHSLLPNDEARNSHAQGWMGSLEKFQRFVTG